MAALFVSIALNFVKYIFYNHNIKKGYKMTNKQWIKFLLLLLALILLGLYGVVNHGINLKVQESVKPKSSLEGVSLKQAQPISAWKSVAVKEFTNVYNKPNGKKVGAMRSGESLNIIESEKGWTKIVWGKQGYETVWIKHSEAAEVKSSKPTLTMWDKLKSMTGIVYKERPHKTKGGKLILSK